MKQNPPQRRQPGPTPRNCRRRWAQPYDPWRPAGRTVLPPESLTTAIAGQVPIGGASTGGSMTVWGFTGWATPRTVAGRLICDVQQLTATLAWARADIGVGQRQYAFWFTPGVGLLAFGQDGVVYERTSL